MVLCRETYPPLEWVETTPFGWSVVDDATMDPQLNGSYTYDAQGVSPKRVELVDGRCGERPVDDSYIPRARVYGKYRTCSMSLRWGSIRRIFPKCGDGQAQTTHKRTQVIQKLVDVQLAKHFQYRTPKPFDFF